MVVENYLLSVLFDFTLIVDIFWYKRLIKRMRTSAKSSNNSMNVIRAKPNQRPITPPASEKYEVS